MKSQTITTVLVITLAVFGVFVWGYGNQGDVGGAAEKNEQSSAADSSLIAPEILYDFGEISMKNGTVQREFIITNPAQKDIMLSSVVTSCMCTTAYIVGTDGSVKGPFGMPGHGGSVPPANEVVRAGESRIIRVVFDPNAHGPAGVGMIDRFITLTEEGGETVTLEIKAVVTP